MSISNTITVEPFSPTTFIELARERGGGKVTDQVTYLSTYLQRLGAKTLVWESRYTDRHYIDEYAGSGTASGTARRWSW